MGAAAERLETLSLRCPAGSSGREVLAWIAEDARAGGRALAGVSLLDAYPPEALVPDAPPRHSGLIATLGTLRDVAVFVPIVLTWLSLWFAFEDFMDAPRGTNFVQLWAEGFGGTAVFIVVLLISGVVLVTLWLQRLEWAAERDASRAALRQEVAGQLAVVTMELARHAVLEAAAVPAGQLVGIARDITRSTAELSRTMTHSADRMAEIFAPGPEGRFVAALDQWTRSAGELREMGRSLTVPHELLRDFARMRDELRADEEATRQSLSRLLTELRKAAGSSQEANRVHATVADEVSETTRKVGEAMRLFVDNSQRLYAYMEELERVLALLETGRTGGVPVGAAMTNSDGYADGYAGADGYGGPPGDGQGNHDGRPATGGPGGHPGPPPGTGPAAPDAGAIAPPRRPSDDWYGEGPR
ncbi:hypothetical protein AB0L35_15680 [Streptomyces sp. NPDC052309]|uniref:hypothetical protein n=1 Tax=Streptomyces sp. NPDC052309 TaxID=3155421 RepID=UPI00342C1389